MYQVTATTPLEQCNGKNCPMLAVDPTSGDVLIQGNRTSATDGLPAIADHEDRVTIPAAVWASLLAQHTGA